MTEYYENPYERNRPTIIILTQDTMRLIHRLATRRQQAGQIRPLISGDDPYANEVRGLMAEFACAEHFGVQPARWVYDHRGGPPDDLRVDGMAVQIKSTKHWNEPCLIVQPGDTHNDRYINVSVTPMSGQCGLRGWTTGKQLERVEPRPFRGKPPPCVWLENNQLEPMETWGDARPRPDLTDEADYQRCRSLARYTDIEGAIQVRGRRATLINALISLPHYPPGCRVVFLDEREVVRGSKTKKNPNGTPISRDYRSEEVFIVGA